MKKKTFKKKAKDPGIPNSLPFKEQILKELQEEKKRAEEYREMVKTQMKQQKLTERAKLKATSVADLAKSAEIRGKEFENNNKNSVSSDGTTIVEKDTSNLKAFYKEFQKVVEASDIIVEVLDARDPLGTRCFDVENAVLKNSPNKRIIFLINKTDLVPRDNLHKWLKYLRNEFPTLPFKASTQNQKHNLGRNKVNILLSNDELLKSSKCLGADALLKLLNNYCRNKNIKTSITVGIVGFPNVGKSSVINSLKRNQVCNVGATPGLTKSIQTISLDKHIKLLDSPGVVFAKNTVVEGGSDHMSSILALRNAINIDNLADPTLPIEALLNRINRSDLMTFYRLTHFDTPKEFLNQVAKRFGKMLKGGILDLNSAAKKVLQDWNCGKIKYYTLPPDNASSTISAEIVSQMSKEFNVNDFVYEELMNTDETDEADLQEAFVIKSLVDEDDGQNGVSQMEQDGASVVNSSRIVLNNTVKPKASQSANDNDDVEMEELEGMQLNKTKKLLFKKEKKQRKRDAKLSNKFQSSVNVQEDYDFDDYF